MFKFWKCIKFRLAIINPQPTGSFNKFKEVLLLLKIKMLYAKKKLKIQNYINKTVHSKLYFLIYSSKSF